MKKTLLLLLSAASLMPSANSLEAQLFTVNITLPQSGQVVGDSVFVRATVASQFQLAEVRASVEDSSIVLTYNSGAFEGLLILAGLTSGAKTLVVTARDVYSQTGADSVSIIHEPKISIRFFSWPEAETWVPGKLYLSAKAITADTAAQMRLIIDGTEIKRYGAILADTVDLSSYHGEHVTLTVRASDSHEQYRLVDVPVYVDSTSTLVLLSVQKGQILNFNDKFIVSRGESLWVYDRTTLSEVGLAISPPYYWIPDCFFVGDGFVVDAGTQWVSPSRLRIYEWRGGGLTLLTEMDRRESVDFQGAGNFVIWGKGDPDPSVFVRTNLLTGDSVTFGAGLRAGNIHNSLAPNGNYAFWTGDYNIHFYNGTLHRITNNIAGEICIYPSTDGTVIAFNRRVLSSGANTIVLYDGSGETILGWPPHDPQPPEDYCAAYGYVAFVTTSALGDANIWLRLPDGTLRQKTFFGKLRSSSIDQLRPDGAVVVRTSGSMGIPGERSVIDSSGIRRVLCSNLGAVARIDGLWYVAMGRSFLRIEDSPVSVDRGRPEERIPVRFQLAQNYPNPFNPSTTIKYELPRSAVVNLSVYDLLGRMVSMLVNERRDAGIHEVTFDGSGLASGVYFYRFTAGDFVQTRKLVLVK